MLRSHTRNVTWENYSSYAAKFYSISIAIFKRIDTFRTSESLRLDSNSSLLIDNAYRSETPSVSASFDSLIRAMIDVVSVVSDRHEDDQGKGRRGRGSERNCGRQLEGRSAVVRCHSRASDRLYAWKMGLVFIGIGWCTSCGRYALMFNAGPYWNCAYTAYTKAGWPCGSLRRPRVDVREPSIAEAVATRDSPRISRAYIPSWRLAARHVLLGIFINRIISSVAPLPG